METTARLTSYADDHAELLLYTALMWLQGIVAALRIVALNARFKLAPACYWNRDSHCQIEIQIGF